MPTEQGKFAPSRDQSGNTLGGVWKQGVLTAGVAAPDSSLPAGPRHAGRQDAIFPR